MIKKELLILLSLLLMFSCGSSKKITSSTKNNNPTKADKIVWTAVTYKGTPYKYGGTTKKGMDCSGLIYTSFHKRGVDLPRVSYSMAKEGKAIALTKVSRGDLLFFKTSKTQNKINHVGLVTSARGIIRFIHVTLSKGVIISSLEEAYWKNAFVKAKRIL